MSGKRISFGPKPAPAAAEAWVQGNGSQAAVPPLNTVAAKADIYTARLTIDVTPELRGRIKVADMIRDMLETRFPDETGGAS